MTWYNTGTISVANGALIVDGVGTEFVANVARGDSILIKIGAELFIYMIDQVASNTRLMLHKPFEATSVVAGAYEIITMNASARYEYLSYRLNQILGSREVTDSQYRNWVSGAVNGGASLNGVYPLTGLDDVTAFAKSPAQIEYEANQVMAQLNAGVDSLSNYVYVQSLLTPRMDELEADNVTLESRLNGVDAALVGITDTVNSVEPSVTALNAWRALADVDIDSLLTEVSAISATLAVDIPTRSELEAHTSVADVKLIDFGNYIDILNSGLAATDANLLANYPTKIAHDAHTVSINQLVSDVADDGNWIATMELNHGTGLSLIADAHAIAVEGRDIANRVDAAIVTLEANIVTNAAALNLEAAELNVRAQTLLDEFGDIANRVTALEKGLNSMTLGGAFYPTIQTLGQIIVAEGVARYYAPRESLCWQIEAYVTSPPVGDDLRFSVCHGEDVLHQGVITKETYRVVTEVSLVFTPDYPISVNIDAVGTAQPGRDLTVRLHCK
jgi:hypothetical protein